MSHHIAVVTGGSTPERNVALAGAAQVVSALRERGHRVSVVDTALGELAPDDEAKLLVDEVGRAPPTPRELTALKARELGADLVTNRAVSGADVVFLVLHGRQGEGGEIQALLDIAEIPYAGSGPLGSAVAMDKDLAKTLFRSAGIPTPAWAMWPATKDTLESLGFPLVVKPSRVGSTVGLSLVDSPSGLQPAVEAAAVFDSDVILEQFVPGRELTVGMLGERPLAVGEIIPEHTVFDYECKYTPGMCREIFPAPVSVELARQVQSHAARAHVALKLRDFSRVDFRVTPDGKPYCLEANTLPGLTRTSLLPQSAAAAGIPFGALCETICECALKRAESGNKVRA